MNISAYQKDKTYPNRKTIPLVKVMVGSIFLGQAKFYSRVILLIALFFQCYFFWTTDNIIAIANIAIVWLVVTEFIITDDMIRKYPLSLFIVIGFASTQFYFPLLFTSLEFKPVVYNLEKPQDVFFHASLVLIVLFIAHYIYRLFPLQRDRESSILKRLGFFETPQNLQLWIMGLIGFLANIYVLVFNQSLATEISGDASGKAIQALFPFAYAPYFIPFKSLFGGVGKVKKSTIYLLIAFTIMLFIVSIARNSRGVFMIGFTSIGFAYFLGLLIGIFRIPKVNYKIVLLAVFGIWFVNGPLGNLGTAMLLVRSERSDLSKKELIEKTWVAMKDDRAIALRRLEDRQYESDWDERYLDNAFASRFATVKYSDASLVQAEKVGINNPQMRSHTINYVWGALPDPVLRVIKPEIDKESLYAQSFGDYIYNLAGAGNSTFGGYRLGNMSGTGMAAFGYWYLVILGLVMIPVFLLFDKFIIRGSLKYRLNGKVEQNIIFSVCGLLALTSIFQYLPTESVAGPFTFLIRGYIQSLFLYFIMFKFSGLFVKSSK
ncbi:hypothetical protein EV200_105433 [Pedobacter psychrotolerans]|uniref:O-antigen polysaccharide polymerase Wzy-like protein n=1 Tax=Pedobacter psychrotolerans TaxID=1843235 RepID=A0A4R2HA69_9SPHI|nr:hypothetical protein [Pedobacter psychrotolerans]TCO23958.1 hypothetical protein EV200_105433 [Pedobacter psychrotolerans]GGE63890.1 hypothetical protein GCM10011413_32910 [Pedobacter psychrotolerans]